MQSQVAAATVLAVIAVPIYHKLIKPVVLKKQKEQEKKEDAPPPGGRRSRRPSVIHELASVSLILRVLLRVQCLQGLVFWLGPKLWLRYTVFMN